MNKIMPKTMEQAKHEVAKLYLEYKEVQEKFGFDKNSIAYSKKDGSDISEDERKEIKRAWDKVERYCVALYSMPWLKKKMKAWMVDVKFGTENPFSNRQCCAVESENMEENIPLLIEDPEGFTEKMGGSLMKNVSDFLSSRGFVITDRGGGGCGGHIGCPCTDAECEELLTLININFKKAIDSGMIFPKIAWFKPNVFRNNDHIEEWIKEKGMDK